MERAVRSSDASNASLLLSFCVVLADSLEKYAARDNPATCHWVPFEKQKSINLSFKLCNSQFSVSHDFRKVGDCGHICRSEFTEELPVL